MTGLEIMIHILNMSCEDGPDSVGIVGLYDIFTSNYPIGSLSND